MSSELDLAEPYRIQGFSGSLSDYLEHLEWQYRAFVGKAGIRLWGRRVLSSGAKAPDGRDRLFWHVVTHGTAAHTEDSRKLDLMRASLLPRVWDVLERLAAGDPRACWWQEDYRGGSYLHVAPVDFGLHVSLKYRGPVFLLRMAYPVVGRKVRSVLMERAARSWQSGRSRRDAVLHHSWRTTEDPPHIWPEVRHAKRWQWESRRGGIHLAPPMSLCSGEQEEKASAGGSRLATKVGRVR